MSAHDAPFSPGATWRIAWPIAMVMLGIATLVITAAVADSLGASSDAVSAVGAFVGSGVILLGGLLLMRVLPPAQRRVALATKGGAWSTAWIGFGIGLACIMGSAMVITAGVEIDPGAKRALEDLDVNIGSAWWHTTLVIIALVLFAPVGEELLFRGLALRGLVRLMPLAIAAPASGLLFTAAHLDAWLVWPRAAALVLVGWALAWLYRWRGMLAAMVAHATVNVVAAIALIAQS
jgi:membrane protease YdiL (CAAX protease family)